MGARKGGTDMDIQRELGRLTESVDNSKEDRAEMKALISKLVDFTNDLRGSVDQLSQTVQSMSNQVLAINSEKCGQRLDALEALNTGSRIAAVEEDVKFYKRVFGAAWGLFWRIAGLVAAAGGVGGAVAVAAKHFHIG